MNPAGKSMFLYIFSITLVIFASVLYHISQKQIPAEANPAASIVVTYLASLVLCLFLFIFFPPVEGVVSAFIQLNWASYSLALSLVGLEVGFLLVYRAGWSIGLAAVLTNVAAALILLPIALFFFRDELNWVNITGILVCLAGLVMLNWKR